MSITLTWGPASLNLNDGTDYQLSDGGFDPGVTATTWDEVGNYAATYARQVNVQTSSLVQMRIVLLVTGTSHADLKTHIDALNTICALSSATMTYSPDSGTTTYVYTTVYSPAAVFVRDDSTFLNKFKTFVTLEPMRRPAVA
jgi:hypothetical protein